MASTTQLACNHLHVSRVADMTAQGPKPGNRWRCDECKLLLIGELKRMVISVKMGPVAQPPSTT